MVLENQGIKKRITGYSLGKHVRDCKKDIKVTLFRKQSCIQVLLKYYEHFLSPGINIPNIWPGAY